MKILTRGAVPALILSTLLLSLGSQCARAQSPPKLSLDTGSISGRVTVGDKPASGVVITAFGDNPNRRPAGQVTADSDGRYLISGLAAGQYNVRVQAPLLIGIGSSLYGTGKTVALSLNEAVDSIDFKLARGAVITGRVTDSDNKPVIEERVNLDLLDDAGKPQRSSLPSNYQMYQTDDRGIYRLYGLPPGHYKVSVGNSATGGYVTMGTRAYFQQTFYPDATDSTKATVVDLAEGSEATNIDIVVGRRNPTYSASGRIVDADTGEPVGGIQVGYGRAPKDQTSFGAYIIMPVNSRGEFRVEGLEPGRYGASLNSQYGSRDFYSDPTFFEVVDSDLTDLEIKAVRGLNLNGVVVTDGITNREALTLLRGLTIGAGVQGTASGVRTYTTGSSSIATDGSFQIAGLRPGKASLSLYNYGTPALRGFSITRIERDGIDQSQGIDLVAGQQVTGLQVFLSYGTGIVRGTVKIEGGTMPPDGSMYIRASRPGSPSTNGAQVDARGRFTITGLSSGTYELTLQVYFPNSQSKRPPPMPKQTVSVTDGAETETSFTLDLTPPNGP